MCHQQYFIYLGHPGEQGHRLYISKGDDNSIMACSSCTGPRVQIVPQVQGWGDSFWLSVSASTLLSNGSSWRARAWKLEIQRIPCS